MNIVILGLTITSSWGNGHATTYRGLVRELAARGHNVLFLERDLPWYAANRDEPNPSSGCTQLYRGLEELKDQYSAEVRAADLVMVGSYVPQGVEVGHWVTSIALGTTAFYDIDTPVTLAKLEAGDHEYLEPALVGRYDLYLSFTGGPTLERLVQKWGARRALPLHCSVDPSFYQPEQHPLDWDLGYLGTYSEDRQPALDRLLLEPARRCPEARFAVFGPQYPPAVEWPANVERQVHLAPAMHSRFYNRQRFTLNITRTAMVRAGYSPSMRLFEAAACATPIITDYWPGLETFFVPGREILVARSAEEVLHYLHTINEEERLAIGWRARRRVLTDHTASRRADQLEDYVLAPRQSMTGSR